MWIFLSDSFLSIVDKGDPTGKTLLVRGRQDDTGQIYSHVGSYEGRVDGSGRLYDNQGGYEGRIEKQ